MKVVGQVEDKEFKPFNLIITIESIDEAARFYALFNNTSVIVAAKLQDIAEDVRGVISKSTEGQTLLHGDHHRALCKINK